MHEHFEFDYHSTNINDSDKNGTNDKNCVNSRHGSNDECVKINKSSYALIVKAIMMIRVTIKIRVVLRVKVTVMGMVMAMAVNAGG